MQGDAGFTYYLNKYLIKSNLTMPEKNVYMNSVQLFSETSIKYFILASWV